MIWYAHRRDDKTIASVHEELQPGYAEEPLDDQKAELKAWFAKNCPPPADMTVQEKLASIGLSIDDLKQALGVPDGGI